MTNKCLVTILTAFAGLLAMAHPDGFVYRGRISRLPVGRTGKEETVGFTASLYRDLGASTPLWTGHTNVTVSADGSYQVWISDAMRLKDQDGGSETLVDALTLGHATALGITLGDGAEELKPRISLSTLPMVRFARNTSNIDDGGVVTGRAETDYLVAQENAILGRTVVSNGVKTMKMEELPLRVDTWETTGTAGIVLKKSSNKNRRIFSDAKVQHLAITNTPSLKLGTVLVGPGSDALIKSERGGVVSLSYGRLIPCASFFVNPGESFKLPFEIPKEISNSYHKNNVILNFLEYGD